ncbi:MAG TPA: ABC transporter permease [Flavitalea sp.]|nr:ABC transporter permease [Flavitalea sp.]
MIKNYLTTALRNLWKNKSFSAINLLGLALGMASSLLIILWVQDERNMDAFHVNRNRLYSVFERQYYDGKVDAFHAGPGIMAEEMKKVLPEVEMASQMAWEDESTFQVGEKIMKKKGNHASPDFFSMFSYQLIQGKKTTALNEPLNIAISRKFAEDFFGNAENAMGKTIRYQNAKDLKVTAVFENVSSNSSVKFDYLLTWHQFLESNSWAKEWGNNGPRTLLLLRSDADPRKFESRIIRFLDKYNKDQNAGFRIELGIQKYDHIYLYNNFKNGKISGGRIEYVRLFSLVAIFILLIACINFMNLTTARSVKRSREIGIRKVVGAMRASLIRQFMGEAMLLTFLAILLSILFVVATLPAFNNLTGKTILLPYSEPMFWIGLLLLTLITGFVAGSYPALFLSSFNPIKVLKGPLKFTSGAGWLRKGLVVFQFVLSTVLIIGPIVISNQVDYAQNLNLGYDRENLIYIPMEGELAGKYTLLKEEAGKLPGIKLISRIGQNPTQIETGTGGVEWEGKDPQYKPMFTWTFTGYDFIKTMGLTLIAGRDFSKDFPTDSVGYLLNESALAKMGLKDPIGKPLTMWQRKGTIIGILKDFHYNSIHVPINPMIISLGEKENWGNILVRIEAGKTKQALAGLEKICKKLNPMFPFTYLFTDEEYAKLYKSEQMVSKLSNCFAALAIFISCLGLLGLAMFTAGQRTKEIGIRKVLGASVTSVFALLSREFLLLVFISLLIATPIAWWAMSKWLEDFAYREPISGWVFLIAGVVAILITLFTVSFQAIKAAIRNPVKSLRTE